MALRASWKGTLQVAELTCPVALYAAASTSDRIAFHTINRATGHRVRRDFVDSETGKPVAREDQVKGYEVAPDEHIILTPEEVEAAIPDTRKLLEVAAFVPCAKVDDSYFDKPYFLAPASPAASEAFALIRDGLRDRGVAALARAVLFRRMRTVLLRPQGAGIVGTTLNFDYEVRSAAEAFKDIPDRKIEGEMLDLARHIIATREGTFDITAFDDRYEEALADLVKAKLEGRKIKPAPKARKTAPTDLLQALRKSAAATKPARAAPRREAG
jgi:DNA end-binding protein Ku